MDKFIATKNDQGRTIFKFLQKIYFDVPLTRLEKLCRVRDVKINNVRILNKRQIIKMNDKIIVYGLVSQKHRQWVKTKILFKVIYEDLNILVVSKPINVPMHDGKNALDNQVLTYLDFKAIDSFTASHIGRLDKVTSGLVIYAKNYLTLVALKAKQIYFKKIYVFKSSLNKNLTAKVFLAHNENRQREEVAPWGKLAITKFFITSNGLQKAQLLSGRKHQIRATLAHLKAPIWGDVKYGGNYAKRVYLHCTELELKGLEGNLQYLNHLILRDPITW